jgi:hypothetical protein
LFGFTSGSGDLETYNRFPGRRRLNGKTAPIFYNRFYAKGAKWRSAREEIVPGNGSESWGKMGLAVPAHRGLELLFSTLPIFYAP